MRVLSGTSGFSYKEWKGSFYPEDLANADMLRYYAERLPTVEINNTFYHMPRASVVEHWAEQVPDGFTFVIKASQRITHRARLKDAEEPLAYLWETISKLGPHRGPILFQLPPFFKKDTARLEAFLAALPDGCRAVFEFRHASWRDEEVNEALRAAGAALCVADTEDEPEPELVATADFGYLRLRRPGYEKNELEAWVERVLSQPWREAFVFFKHEDEASGPRMAEDFASLCEGA